MTVSLRVKRSQESTGRRRRGGAGPVLRGRLQRNLAPPHEPVADRGGHDGLERGPRVPPAPQDRALYSCACGFVFSHDVSTSVACPHCGGTQAW